MNNLKSKIIKWMSITYVQILQWFDMYLVVFLDVSVRDNLIFEDVSELLAPKGRLMITEVLKYRDQQHLKTDNPCQGSLLSVCHWCSFSCFMKTYTFIFIVCSNKLFSMINRLKSKVISLNKHHARTRLQCFEMHLLFDYI